MEKRDTTKLRKGDWIRLKNNLGEGTFHELIEEPTEECAFGKFPMIRYKDNADNRFKFATYILVKEVIPLWVEVRK